MRDIVIIFLVIVGALSALRKPWIGVILWTWLSIMNPHRLAWGIAYDAPLAAVAAISTMLGALFTRDRESPFKGAPVVFLILFMGWITLSWRFGLDVDGDYPQWDKIMKVDFMIFIALVLLRTKQHVFALTWIAAGSLALLGAKGGIFTLINGGQFRVYGPPGSFIEDNNEFAAALVMTIPLLRFLQLQIQSVRGRHVMTAVMVLCAASALGSQSRGALLAIGASSLLLWWRGKSRMLGGVVIVIVAIGLVAFMPDTWSSRMNTISDYEEDRSALGRISAWWTAWHVALHYPLGVGFNVARPDLFALYSPYPDFVHAAHSIYFQVLGNHGFVGLFLFMAIWVTTWQVAGSLRKLAEGIPEARWCAELGSMCQVSLLAYGVGGAFLSLAYFDLPYNVMVMVLVARAWVMRRGWEKEPVYAEGWKTIPGLALARKAG